MANTEKKQDTSYLDVPVYKPPASYARENGELDQFRASRRANIACKEAIDSAITEHYAYSRLDPAAVKQVVEQFGAERTAYVLANTVQQKDWDKRFSTSNRQWANTIPVIPNPDGFRGDLNDSFVVQSHSVKTALFITLAREDQLLTKDARRDQKQRQPRASVLEKLHNTAPVSEQKKPAKQKEQAR